MSMGPRARLVPELRVDSIRKSLAFWCDVLGFRIKYERPEVQFAYIELDGAELMLDQRGSGPADRRGIWVTGPMERPYGRGINLEIQTAEFDATLARVKVAGIPIYFGPEERWYRTGDVELGVRQFLVQDPDGYLVRMQQGIGERPLSPTAPS